MANNQKSFFLVISFTVRQGILQDLMDWLEKDHYQKMIDTGCFVDAIKKFGPGKQNKNDFVGLSYVLETRSPKTWEKYKTHHLSRLHEELLKRWELLIQTKDVNFSHVAGQQEIMHLVGAHGAPTDS